jgi:hypothetical protein
LAVQVGRLQIFSAVVWVAVVVRYIKGQMELVEQERAAQMEQPLF